MQVKYTGGSDLRILGAADLKKVGVEGFRHTEFVQHQPTEVSDEVGRALIEEDLFDGEFEEVVEDEPKSVGEPAADLKDDAAKVKAAANAPGSSGSVATGDAAGAAGSGSGSTATSTAT